MRDYCSKSNALSKKTCNTLQECVEKNQIMTKNISSKEIEELKKNEVSSNRKKITSVLENNTRSIVSNSRPGIVNKLTNIGRNYFKDLYVQ